VCYLIQTLESLEGSLPKRCSTTKDRLLVLLENVRLGWKNSPGTRALGKMPKASTADKKLIGVLHHKGKLLALPKNITLG
jgi:hypothetical protein